MKTIVWITSSSEWALSKSLHKHFIAVIYVIVLSLPSPAASDVDTSSHRRDARLHAQGS